jgi:hypothetical protein
LTAETAARTLGALTAACGRTALPILVGAACSCANNGNDWLAYPVLGPVPEPNGADVTVPAWVVSRMFRTLAHVCDHTATEVSLSELSLVGATDKVSTKILHAALAVTPPVAAPRVFSCGARAFLTDSHTVDAIALLWGANLRVLHLSHRSPPPLLVGTQVTTLLESCPCLEDVTISPSIPVDWGSLFDTRRESGPALSRLQYLSAGGHSLSTAALETLCRCVPQLRGFEAVNAIQVTHAAWREALVAWAPTLQHLSVDGTPFLLEALAGPAALSAGTATTARCTFGPDMEGNQLSFLQLEEFRVRGHTAYGADHFSDTLAPQLAAVMPNVRVLSIGGIGGGIEALLDQVPRLTRCAVLEFANIYLLTDDVVVQLLHKTRGTLKRLIINGCQGVLFPPNAFVSYFAAATQAERASAVVPQNDPEGSARGERRADGPPLALRTIDIIGRDGVVSSCYAVRGSGWIRSFS